jgi:hypothetical protein
VSYQVSLYKRCAAQGYATCLVTLVNVCLEYSCTDWRSFRFVLVRRGKFTRSEEIEYPYPAENPKHGTRDAWLIREMREAYARHFSSRFWIPIRKICFAKYIRVSEPQVNQNNLTSINILI